MLDPVSQNIVKYMDVVAQRQKLVAANIANVDTPGYRTQDLDFEAEMNRQTAGEPARPIGVPDLKVKNDGNDVSIDRESKLLAENGLRFRLATSLLRDRFNMLKQAVQSDKS